MNISAKLKPYDVYPVAIRAELDAAEIYRGLQVRVKNEVLRQKLDFLAKEEDRHKAILERLFHDHYPERKLVVPAESKRPKTKVAVDETAAVLGLFKLAMQKEKEAEEYYKDAKAAVEDAQSRKIFEYLARVERSHFYMLQSEVGLIEKFPDYYDADAEYFGQDLFHVGG
jgi:rubrerythrin